MGGTYSRVVEATVTGGVSNCIEIPVPPRGTLERVIVKQTSGTDVDFDFVIYNRKGACPSAIDLHVNGGAVTAVTNNGGSTQLTFTTTQTYPYGYDLAVGDKIYVKGTNVPGYNVVHTIVSVDSTTQVTTDIAYSAIITTNGVWQDSEPQVYGRSDPSMHIVNASTTGTAGNASASFNMDRVYENADNQDVTARRLNTSLWVDLQPDGAEAGITYEVAYTSDVQYDF
tara:strand:- start:3234 stop:3914 length:681 start_codon:yes stop_codon:yes gene_type:complete